MAGNDFNTWFKKKLGLGRHFNTAKCASVTSRIAVEILGEKYL